MATRHVIFIAAENGALPRGKVGGVGDVVSDLPPALAGLGWRVTVLTPSYGMFAALPGAAKSGSLEVPFAGGVDQVDVFELPSAHPRVRQVVVEHPRFQPAGPGRIYCELENEGPFATDAAKFAFFGAVAAEYVSRLERPPDAVHLHDWHAAFYCLFRSFSPDHEALADIRTVFTIHNLAYQGTRPLDHDASSLAAWLHDFSYDPALVRDPAAHHCINPMALAIRTADRVSTVSPTYAREILRPSDPARGFIGGEGLERQLGNAARSGRLVGILNGCDYGGKLGRRPGWQRLLGMAREQVERWLDARPGDATHVLARARIDALPRRRPQHVLVSIGRLVRQKVSLFLEELDDGRTALEHVVERLGKSGVLVLLGSGEPAYESRVGEIAAPLYRGGDLFLMPSGFEPCGISQMLAMRAAQPVVAHAVGGLCDTIEDGRTGFLFAGETPQLQARAFVATVDRALAMKTADHERWQNLCIRAASRRFDWQSAARATINELYEQADTDA
ncbi:MAG: glycogen/starch synthase [Woeseiaceae bacterium]|nr:glycogen/starch synthase [Woeseiaceae bacterium]